MDLFIEIVYVFVTIVLILVVLLQAGRGGGLGTALGGGASQGVFGGGGSADFLAKLTQGLAAGFMICAVYLAYASAHSGSTRLQAEGDDAEEELFDPDQAVDYERVGEGTPMPLPEPGSKPTVVPEPAEEPVAEPATIEIPMEVETTPIDSATIEGPATPAEGLDAEGAVVESPAPATDEVEAPTAEPEPAKVTG